MPAAGGKFLSILEAFLYIPDAFWTCFSRKNAPEILKISRLRRAYTSISPPIGGEISEISPPDPSDQGGQNTPISPLTPQIRGEISSILAFPPL